MDNMTPPAAGIDLGEGEALLREARERAGVRVGQWPELVRELCDALEREQLTRDRMRRQMAEALLEALRERDELRKDLITVAALQDSYTDGSGGALSEQMARVASAALQDKPHD